MFLPALLVAVSMIFPGRAGLQAEGGREISFDAFMKIDASKRQDVFVTLTPENRARLKREHGERWLRAHRSALSARQIRVVENAIAFVTPAIYATPDLFRAREEAIKNELLCALGEQAAAELFGWSAPGGTPHPTSTLDDWLRWFSGCVGKEPAGLATLEA